MIETKNAVIKAAKLTTGDHGILTAWLDLDYGGSSQGFGGYVLYAPPIDLRPADLANYAGRWIWRCLEVAGEDEWSRLAGKCIRVRSEHSRIEAIGHIIKDIWFDPKAEFEAMMPVPAQKPAEAVNWHSNTMKPNLSGTYNTRHHAGASVIPRRFNAFDWVDSKNRPMKFQKLEWSQIVDANLMEKK